MEFWRFTTPDPQLGPPLDGIHDPLLVLISILIAWAAGLTAMLMVDRMIASTSTAARAWWHGAGAVVMGCGIWGMHFTGMLALSVPINMGYGVPMTLLSLVPAILGSGVALYFLSASHITPGRLHLGALLLALGIGTMHYTGMEAIKLEGLLRYDSMLFVLSIVVAFVMALGAIYVRFGLRRFSTLSKGVLKGVAGLIMGLAIVSMHYIAMASARLHEVPGKPIDGIMFPLAVMGTTIGGFAVVIMALAMLAVWVNQQKAVQRMFENLAHTDALTGLPNRMLLMKQLEHATALCGRNQNRLAVLLVDLNDFKSINDSLGHEAGDFVLQAVGKRLQDTVRETDWVGRFGGDEFIIIAQNLHMPEDAAQAAERVLAALEAPVPFAEWKLSARSSLGISIYPDDGETPNELVQYADAAMYRAKGKGGGWHYYNSAYADDAMERVWVGVELGEALKNNDLVIHYQPWVDLESGRWVGLEALSRWQHATEGAIAPDRFIPVAERTGMIFALGNWVLGECCRQARAWVDKNVQFGRIAFNISATELTSPDLIERIRKLLNETGIEGARLEMEITESSLIDSKVIERVQEIRGLGLTVSVDDFGTEYSSLSYLRILSVDKVKIDRSFVQNITDDPRDRAIIRAVVDMGSSLGFSVVAEGVETEEQRTALMETGCAFGQGYLFARPAGVEVIEPLAAQMRR